MLQFKQENIKIDGKILIILDRIIQIDQLQHKPPSIIIIIIKDWLVFLMHICFIIDNCPLTLQPYSHMVSQNNTNSNISILDTLKISIQTTLNDLFRSGVLLRDYQNLHLFQTSTPYTPVSSFEHDLLHFNYQLKQIKAAENLITYPAQTIKYALNHISKFRILTETQTILGYREGVIYEPAIIMFFSYGLTLRKINKIEQLKLYKYMRSQYKFVHFRVCFGSQNERDKNLEKFKTEIENTVENKKLVEWIQKMNRGEHKNITKYIGKQNLSNAMINLLTSYAPSLSCQFSIDCEINVKFPAYFNNSEINYSNFVSKEENNVFKIDLMIKNDENTHNSIPLPLELTLKENERDIPTIAAQLQIQQLTSLRFCVDLSKKLSASITNAIPFDKYFIPSNSSKLIRLQKQLERLGIAEIFFPVYTPGPSKKQKDYCVIGLLRFHNTASNGSFFQLALSFPNFPFIQIILKALQTQSSYSDSRKIQKYLFDYNNEIPQYYYKFLIEYFKYLNIELAYKYQSIATSQSNSHHIIRINKFIQKESLSNTFKSQRRSEKMQLEATKKENTLNHLNNTTTCCLIYGDLDKYIDESRKQTLKFLQSKTKQKQKQSQASIFQEGENKSNAIKSQLKNLLNQISKFNHKYDIKSYFSGSGGWKEGPITRQLDKYGRGMLRMVNEGSIPVQEELTSDILSRENERIDIQGLLPNKKIKFAEQFKNQKQAKDRKFPQFCDQQIQVESVIPQKSSTSQNEVQEQFYFPTAISSPQIRSHIREYELKLNTNIYNQNSVAVNNIVEHQSRMPSIEEMREVERELIHNKIQVEKKAGLYSNVNSPLNMEMVGQNQQEKYKQAISYFPKKMTSLSDNSIPQIVKKSSSVDYQSEQEIYPPEKPQRRQQQNAKVGMLLSFINSLSLENPTKMRLNNCNIRDEIFMENLEKLKKVGLIKDIDKYKGNALKNK